MAGLCEYGDELCVPQKQETLDSLSEHGAFK